MSLITTKKDNDVLVVVSDNPPVNALGREVRAGLAGAVKQAAADNDIKAIVIRCAGRTFFAGADITEFGKPPVGPNLPETLDAMEASDKPVVAAIHGTALGGGCEVALACHYRVAVPSARLGLPEVNLGLLPGAGGTQRLPRVVGVETALSMMTSGRHVPAIDLKLFNEATYVQALDGDILLEAFVAAEAAFRLDIEVALLEAASAATTNGVAKRVLELMARDRRRHADFGWLYLEARKDRLTPEIGTAAEAALATVSGHELAGLRIPAFAEAGTADDLAEAYEVTAKAGLGAASLGDTLAAFSATVAASRTRLAAASGRVTPRSPLACSAIFAPTSLAASML